jgi:protein-disulfide isomerase
VLYGGRGSLVGHPVRVPRNRLLLLAGAVALAAVVVVAVVVVAGGGSSDATTTAETNTGRAASIFAGIPQHGDVLGKPDAPVTLEVYEDPQCPYCRQWNLDTLPTVISNYVSTGRLKIRYRGIVVIGLNSVAGLRAIYAAGNQGKLWNMVESLYRQQGAENSGWITLPVIRGSANDIGADADRVIKDADSASTNAAIKKSQADAVAAQVKGTPSFVVVKQLAAPQQLQVAGLEPDQFTPALDAALQ